MRFVKRLGEIVTCPLAAAIYIYLLLCIGLSHASAWYYQPTQLYSYDDQVSIHGGFHAGHLGRVVSPALDHPDYMLVEVNGRDIVAVERAYLNNTAGRRRQKG